MGITENAAYLKGLAEGLGLNEEAPKDKLTLKLLDLVAEMAEKIEDLQAQCDDLNEYADELDADLGDVEDYLFSDDDDEDDEFDDDEDGVYEVTCPSCGEVICFDDSVDPEDLICPSCGEEFDAVCDGCIEGDCETCGKNTDEEDDD